MSYTKGEWKVKEDKEFINPYGAQKPTRRLNIVNDNTLLATIWAEDEFRNTKTAIQSEAEGNAKLISAAPDLLEALQNIVNAVESGGDYHPKIFNAKAAIKKAA